ncbi:hypothetical protein D9619_003453 [Psilocybe cf. subviscida]|uniref:Cas1p 10 TM acyl transferase domain-containing protein n=1 Tax=Psilocybe cf. subviscida TaxID=2480587 RepID=A0A8H5AWB5_9AGAR|nr:hypothetical protein D9619_003453 [Psilocybe cf. subviscida]
MQPPPKSTLNPAWPHFLGVFALILACFIGLTRELFSGWSDPLHCDALLNEGSWLDSNHRNWQPDGCMLHQYTEKDASLCLQSKDILFIGDSVTRRIFFQVAQSLDASLTGQEPKDETKKHADHTFLTSMGTNITFIWDPFLNSSYAHEAITGARANTLASHSHHRPGPPQAPAMLVLGSGLWYLRYADTSGGISAWEQRMEEVFKTLGSVGMPADEVVILPVSQVVPSKLIPEREQTMRPSDIDAMNSDLYHRINPPTETSRYFLPPHVDPLPVAFPLVFNSMLHESLTQDGVHYSNPLVKLQARILLNLRCNDYLPKVFPLNKTCCSRYPMPSLLHLIFLGFAFTLGPFLCYRVFTSGFGGLYGAILGKQTLPPFIISIALVLIFTADRTGVWLKEHKQYDVPTFALLLLVSLGVGLATTKRADSDMGFLNRDQTDEWKGWMQIVILVYHYVGASKISGIYNPVRVLVASYLFMTGYGHTTFYIRKADYGFLRIAQVLIRLNLFTILLAYTMNTTYISYYFTPLVSMWYLVIYGTMVAGARFNDRAPVVIAKILTSAAFMTWFMNESWLLETVFDILHTVFHIHWSSKEWAFRVNLDIWMVYVGMLASILVIKLRERHIPDHPSWSVMVKAATSVSALTMLWFFAFELYQPSKFAYNAWHPYVSFLPVLAFVVLRNCTATLRSASSRAFAFVGKCSLETFVVQYHFWLAADSKGVLLVIPGTRWRPVNFVLTSIMFIYLCDRISYATGELTNTICGKRPRETPLPVANAPPHPPPSQENGNGRSSEAQEVVISMTSLRAEDVVKDELGQPLLEPDTPIRPGPGRWADQLANGHGQGSKTVSGKWAQKMLGNLSAKIGAFLVLLWILNMLWQYPPGSGY